MMMYSTIPLIYTAVVSILVTERQADALIAGRDGGGGSSSGRQQQQQRTNHHSHRRLHRPINSFRLPLLQISDPSRSDEHTTLLSHHHSSSSSLQRHSRTRLFSMTTNPLTGALVEDDYDEDQDEDDIETLNMSFVNGFTSTSASSNGHHQHPMESMTIASLSAPLPDILSTGSVPVSNGETVNGMSSSHSHHHDEHRHQQRKDNIMRSKKRNKNKAMGDTAFLRKRTSDLMHVTSPDECDAYDASSCDESLGRGGMKVGLKTFNFLIDAWAFSGELDAADQALRLLNRMEEMYYNSLAAWSDQHGEADGQPTDIKICPDVRSYTKVINALSRSMRSDAGEIAEQILDKMEAAYASGENPTAKPNTFTYVATIEAYANSGADGSPQKTEDMLERMIERYQSGDPDVRPNARCFNAAINSYAKSDLPDAAQHAEFIFNRMDALYMAGLEEAKPNSFNYNSLITAWANCVHRGCDAQSEIGYSAQKAAEILDRMEQSFEYGDPACQPTTVSFNAVIDAYAKSGLEDAAERAEEVLLRMEDLYEAGELDVKPNTRSFNSVINAWAKSSKRPDAAEKAQDLLDFMNRLYELGNDTVKPDAHSFCTVINAYARSHMTGKAERANNLFRAMKDAYKNGKKNLRPNVVAVNAVMNACAYTNGDVPEQNRAMEIAHRQLEDLEASNWGSPDHVTYGTFLKVCANQMPDCSTRQQIIEVIFDKSSKSGQVGNLVLQQIRAMGPPELYYHLIGREIEEDLKMEDLPREWWCNVVEGKW
eukprot:CAMPEP_0113451840 /NCGR_PEP_ID=MMETSP0014_2-20120614/6542_1 /TAXON_ID=2857 /ORGANISM="Nitzschia sp." /LENGTH=767 /DNA_ID=CAMNT_0000343201 /DNA_START=314 /DNA_END=2614 /DNA_ORIENTATION=+ /assembly_acc=CAM_ASM_000159